MGGISIIQRDLRVDHGQIIELHNRVFRETALQHSGKSERLDLVAHRRQRERCQKLHFLYVRRLQRGGCVAFCLLAVTEERLAQSSFSLASNPAVRSSRRFSCCSCLSRN